MVRLPTFNAMSRRSLPVMRADRKLMSSVDALKDYRGLKNMLEDNFSSILAWDVDMSNDTAVETFTSAMLQRFTESTKWTI